MGIKLTVSPQSSMIRLETLLLPQIARAHGEILFQLFLKNPIFGHGVGTSNEANYRAHGSDHVSHVMYLESLVEIGSVGSFLFFSFLWQSFRDARHPKLALNRVLNDSETFVSRLRIAIHVSFIAWAVFHLAQYGLSEYHFYLLAGISVVSRKLSSFDNVGNQPTKAYLHAT